MVPSSIKIPLPNEYVFPSGALFLSVDKLVDFDRLQEVDNQARDENGVRVWVVKVMDQDPEAGRFGRSTEVKVKLAADHQPVPPPALALPGGAKVTPVEFVGLTGTPTPTPARASTSRTSAVPGSAGRTGRRRWSSPARPLPTPRRRPERPRRGRASSGKDDARPRRFDPIASQGRDRDVHGSSRCPRPAGAVGTLRRLRPALCGRAWRKPMPGVPARGVLLMRARDLRQFAAESAALLRTMRAHLPASDLVHEIRCPRCGRWIRPRRFDTLCNSCRRCKSTLARPARRPAAPRPQAKPPSREVAPATWTRWDRCPTCDSGHVVEHRPRIDGVACVVWRCEDCGTQTMWAARHVGGVR
jgi:ribosomal protein L37AE/L43A